MELRNQTYLGDCFEIMKSIPDGSIDSIITDPPYKYLKHKLDADYDEEQFINEAWRILKPNSSFAFFGRGQSFYKLNYLSCQKGFQFKEELIWDKMRHSSSCLAIGRCHETITCYVKGERVINRILVDKIERDKHLDIDRIIDATRRVVSKIKEINTIEDLISFKSFTYKMRIAKNKHTITRGDSTEICRANSAYKSLVKGALLSSIMRVPTDHYNYQHPTQKPTLLLQHLINLLTQENELILDPFAGSGTLGLACLKTNREYLLIEKDAEYYDILLNRIREMINILEEEKSQLNLFDLLTEDKDGIRE